MISCKDVLIVWVHFCFTIEIIVLHIAQHLIGSNVCVCLVPRQR